MKSLNIFGDIKVDVKDGDTASTKIIDIEITEKPTGEISLGAGYGSEGGTIGFWCN